MVNYIKEVIIINAIVTDLDYVRNLDDGIFSGCEVIYSVEYVPDEWKNIFKDNNYYEGDSECFNIDPTPLLAYHGFVLKTVVKLNSFRTIVSNGKPGKATEMKYYYYLENM